MFIAAKGLCKSYKNSIGKIDRDVLKELDLSVEKGDMIAIMGPSGSGKTTLLNILGTLDAADKGSLTVDGNQIFGMSNNEMLLFRNRSLGFVFQFHHLLPQCTLWENVLLPTLAIKTSQHQASLRAEQLLRYMNIWDVRNHKPAELSGGECQRAAIARALINQPALLLADEPTGSLDKENAELLAELLISINKETGVTLIVATHSSNMAGKMNKVYSLEDGKLQVS